MFDGSYQIFERIQRPNTVIIIPSIKNKLVCLKQKQPGTNWFMSTPAGRMDVPGEKPKAAALRELLEETGMAPKKIFLWKTIKHTGKIRQNVYFFIARDCQKVTSQKLDPGEKIQVKMLSFKEFLKLSDDPKNHRWLGESLIDMFKARINPKYKKYLKKVFFG